jgi:hypothetical protein
MVAAVKPDINYLLESLEDKKSRAACVPFRQPWQLFGFKG